MQLRRKPDVQGVGRGLPTGPHVPEGLTQCCVSLLLLLPFFLVLLIQRSTQILADRERGAR